MAKGQHTAEHILLPCPFCASLNVGVFYSKTVYVDCRSCGANGPQIGDHWPGDLDAHAVRASQLWNQRKP